MDNWNLNLNSLETTRQQDGVLATLMRNVYIWMTLALIITGMTALLAARSVAYMSFLLTHTWMMWAIMIAELGLVFYLSARIQRITFSAATILFILYSALNGLMLSTIFLAYSASSIATTFFVTAGTFGAMAAIGSFTKKDLSGIGKFALISLIGLIIAGIVNIFLHNTMFDFIISVLGVVIFAGLTAYDSQKIRLMLSQADEVNDSALKIALFGALSLYLDFINLFLYLLRLFGSRD